MTTQTQRLDSSQLDLAGSDARERPPVLPTWSPLGHLGAFRSDPLGLLERARPLGDVVGVRIMHQNAFFLYDADAIQRVLVADHGRFSKSTRGYEALRLLLGNGLVTSEGSFWKRQRRIAQPAFHRRRIAALGQVMQTAATDLSRSWQGRDQLDVADEMMRVTLRIAGEDLSDEAGDVGAAVTGALEYFKALFMSALPVTSWLPLPSHIRGRRATRALDDLVYAIIAERRASDDSGQDLLGMLIDARDEETGEGMSDMQLRDEVLTSTPRCAPVSRPRSTVSSAAPMPPRRAIWASSATRARSCRRRCGSTRRCGRWRGAPKKTSTSPVTRFPRAASSS